MPDYKINHDGKIIFGKNIDKDVQMIPDNLWVEYIKLEYEISKKHNSIISPEKIARYNALKEYFENNKPIDKENVEKSAKALDAAIEKIKQQMIDFDEAADNSVLYTAITNFKKRNG